MIKPFSPPRPGITIYWPFLQSYEEHKWLAQYKFNGQRNLIYFDGKGGIELWSRHEKNHHKHKNYTLPDKLKNLLLNLNLPKHKEVVIDSELLHAKNKDVKNTIVMYDLLYLDKYLANWTQIERLNKLNEICRLPLNLETKGRSLLVDESAECHLWLAESFCRDFLTKFQRFANVEEVVEGVILRRLDSKLREDNPYLGQKPHEVSWMVRCRKTDNKYHH